MICDWVGIVTSSAASLTRSPTSELRENGVFMPYVTIASYLISAIAVVWVLKLHLLPAVFAGLAVHVLTGKVARVLPVSWGGISHKLALAAIVSIVIFGLFGAGMGLWSYLRGSTGMAEVLASVAETIDNGKRMLPAEIRDHLPATVEDLRAQISGMLREHSKKISSAGVAGVATLVHVIFGMVIGGMTALQRYREVNAWAPLTGALYSRAHTLATAFDKVVFAQVKISALNTCLTAIYLMLVLPLFGVRMPLLTVLVPLTFVTGLLPVVGNLISNTVIVLISLGISLPVAGASLAFLVMIHKLEYVFNAKIVGGEVQARAWELLCAMLTFEAAFGAAGLIAAPVIYAWIKAELKAADLVG